MLSKEPEFKYPELVMPPTVERTAVTLWSNGVALDGDIYRPKDLGGDRRAPAVVLSHGWGGSKSSGERYAAKFAAAGVVSLCFTHSGWASSGNRVVLVGDPPELDENNEGVAKVRFVRELLDPLEWIQNYRCAVDYIEGEPNVDPNRIGAWGTSFGGGVAMHNAANDDRIKALAVQVASLSVRNGPLIARGKQRAIDMARGNVASVPQGLDGDLFPRLAGTPHLARLACVGWRSASSGSCYGSVRYSSGTCGASAATCGWVDMSRRSETVSGSSREVGFAFSKRRSEAAATRRWSPLPRFPSPWMTEPPLT